MYFFRNPKEQDGEILPMGSTVEMLSTENPDNDEAEVINISVINTNIIKLKSVCLNTLI